MIEIPLISQDIRPDEVSIRALKTFEFLDKAVDEIFNKIDQRITKNMTRINEINGRLEKASEKIERLKQSKKAIRMYSPARYPIENSAKIKPTFDNNFSVGEIDFNYKLDLPLESTQYKQYSDKLSFFHLKQPRHTVPPKPNIIFNTSSINSLITFVNNENLYLRDTIKMKEKELHATAEQISDDTTDFSRFSTMLRNKQQADNLNYLPTFNQAPDFEFPLDLPDLEGIAGDISFSVPDSELMAPALWSMNIVNDLPNIELLQAEASKKATATLIEKIDIPALPKDIPLPPAIPQNIVQKVSAPPPPPPPPIPAAIQAEIKAVASAPIPVVDDSRSSLMAAIRNAGGKAKLRTVPAADEQMPETTKKKPQQKAPAMDLMSDLHQKLMLRRKGIAGSKEAKKEKSSMMAKVSSLIPPPPSKKEAESDDSDSTSSENNEDDWN